MKVSYHKNYEKMWVKLPVKIKRQAAERIRLFTENPGDRRLNNHVLQAQYRGYWSINIYGNYRALYRLKSPGEVVFTHIGTHSQLYR